MTEAPLESIEFSKNIDIKALIEAVLNAEKFNDDEINFLETTLKDYLLLNSHTLEFVEEEGKEPEPNIEEVWKKGTIKSQIRKKTPAGFGPMPQLLEAILHLKKLKRIQQVENIQPINIEAINAYRYLFGAKAANLIVVKGYLKNILEKFINTNGKIVIPPFHVIGKEIHAMWKKGHNIKTLLYDYWKSLAGKAIYVRSSAIHSEDGINISGAGIYESKRINADASFEEFIAAIETVYKSCESETAQKYQRDHNVPQEEMGLVVQEAIPGIAGNYNTTHDKQIAVLHYEQTGEGDYIPPVEYDKEELMNSIQDNNISIQTSYKWLHSAIDDQNNTQILRLIYTAGVRKLVILGQLLEKAYGQPVQIEFVLTKDNIVHIVQVRPITEKKEDTTHIELPTERSPLQEFFASGKFMGELDILPCTQNNNEREGIVIFDSSIFGSNAENYEAILKSMPKQGAVVIMSQTRYNRGHVERIARERGLTVLFVKEDQKNKIQNRVVQQTYQVVTDKKVEFGQSMQGYNTFLGYKKVLVVADGHKGALYAPQKIEAQE